MATRRYGLRSRKHRVDSTHSLLPFELVAHIASYLAKDTESLLACSATCRLWRNATRPQVFQKVTIGNPPHLQAFYDLVKGDPVIGPWVKKIRFTITRGHPSQRLYPFRWMINAGEILRGLEKNLTKLDSVTFDSVFVGHGPSDYTSLFEVLAKFQTIRRIKVLRCYPSVTPFCNFLYKLPLLDSVSIGSSGPVSADGTAQGTGLIKISSLSLLAHEWNQNNTRTWFTSVIKAASLRNLTIDVLDPSYLGVTNRLLEVTGPYLQSLSIILPKYKRSYGQDPSRLAIMQGINLRHNVVLRDITFHNPNAPEYTSILDQLSSPNLRTVFIVLTFSTLEGIKVKHYKDLDKRLSQPDLKHVEEVCVLYDGILDLYVVAGKIRRVFPSVSARGVLQVQRM